MPVFRNLNFDIMSDDELLALAGQFGIDTTPFTMPGTGGLLGEIGQIPQINAPLPSADIYGGTALPSLGLGVGTPRVEISPEARTTVAGIYDPIRRQAREEILRTATEAAGRRNLAMTDTPIWEPLLRQQALAESQIGGQEAGTVLGLSESLRNFLQQQAQAREGAIQQRAGLEQRMGEFATTAGLQRNQILEAAIQGRFGALNNALLNRTQMLEATRQFQSQFENQLRQQAYQNRLQLSGQLGQTGLGLSGQRFGTPTTTTQVGPLNLGGAISSFGLGLSGLRNSGFF